MAAAAKKRRLESSSAHHNSTSGVAPTAADSKKTIFLLEDILLRPHTYIGSVEKRTQTLWVYENEQMVHRPVTYVPGLYKIFDEILVNAADNKQSDPTMDSLKVQIDADGNCISVYNNGAGIPIEIHQEKGVYVPEMIFGHLLTGGRNGYGAKLTIFFSTEFVIETADGKRQKKYKQVFSRNMGNMSQPSITKCKEGENWTKVTFKPDLLKFNMNRLEEDVVALMKKRVVDLAGTLGKTTKVELNGKRVPVKTFADYVNLYLQFASKIRPEPLPRILEKVNDRWEICVSLSEGQFQQVSFVNLINTIEGGTHVEYVTSQIATHVMNIVNKKKRNANLEPHNVKNHLWVFVNCLIDNPTFDSQTKETLITRQGSFGSKCDISQDFLNKVAKLGVVESLLSWADFKHNKELKKTNETKRQKISGLSKELKLFSMADLQRSIPSMVDGLKPGQRKILFCSFKKDFVRREKIDQFSDYVSKHSAYDHGKQSLVSTIIGMAQDFVGSNNINLLQPNGQFGTRYCGGKDRASARYMCTKLSPITRFLFPKEDDLILDYLSKDGQSIEPTWYVPVIPLVLVNGSKGIGTGWSSYIPNYNPRDIVTNIRSLLNNEPMVPMDPWYRGFKGRIEKIAVKEAGATYTITGIIEEGDNNTLTITELPIRKWTENYNNFIKSLMTEIDKFKEPFIKDYREYNDDKTVHFEFTLSEESMRMAKQKGLDKKFKLTTTINTSNMYLLNHKGVIKKYDTPKQILEEFFHLRITYYDKRKKVLLYNLELDLLKLDNKLRFILGVVKGQIIVNNRKRVDLFLELKAKEFTPFTKKTKGIDVAIVGVATETEEPKEIAEVVKGVVKPKHYDYLLSMAIGTLNWEKIQGLCTEKEKLEKEVEELRGSSPSSLWNRDLDALEKELDELERQDVEAVNGAKAPVVGGFALNAVVGGSIHTLITNCRLPPKGSTVQKKNVEAVVTRRKIREKAGNGGTAIARQAPNKPIRNNTKPYATSEPIAIDSETVQEVTKPKLRGR